MSLLNRIAWWWHRRNNEMPHQDEVMSLFTLRDIDDEMWKKHKRYMRMSYMYGRGRSLEFIAQEYKVPHERVRQCVWKFWRQRKQPDRYPTLTVEE